MNSSILENFKFILVDSISDITGPPGRPAHSFSYTPVDLEGEYAPPAPGPLSPAPLPTTYQYNLDKDLTLITRPDGKQISFEYDAGGRARAMILPHGQMKYHYDSATGNLSGISDPKGGALAFDYDGSLLKKTTWAGMVNGSVSKTYDNNFWITSESVNGANPVSFAYDADGLLVKSGILNLERDPQNGLLAGTTLGSVTDTITYNSFGETANYTAGWSGLNNYTVSYVRDKLGRITQKIETRSGVVSAFDYAYDIAGRLTEVKRNGAILSSYAYDPNGNRLSRTTPAGTVNGTYDNQDRMTSYGNKTYVYSPNGELLSKTDGTVGTAVTYAYDVLGNLLSATLPDGTKIEYVIDGTSRRVGKKVNGTLVQGFLYKNQLNPVAELDGSGNVISRFVYGSRFNVPDYMVKGGKTYRIISDHLGSPRLVVDSATGLVTQEMDYDEFGNVLVDTNPGFQPFGFAGGIYDRDTGLTRFGARDYDPVTGRWTAKDPIRFKGGDTNLYGYTLQDPINFIDVDGLLKVKPHDKILKDLKRRKAFEKFVEKSIAKSVAGKVLGPLTFFQFFLNPDEIACSSFDCNNNEIPDSEEDNNDPNNPCP